MVVSKINKTPKRLVVEADVTKTKRSAAAEGVVALDADDICRKKIKITTKERRQRMIIANKNRGYKIVCDIDKKYSKAQLKARAAMRLRDARQQLHSDI